MSKLTDSSTTAKQMRIEQGVRLKRARCALGLTQEYCAHYADISREALAKMEIGLSRVDSVAVVKLQDACGWPLVGYVLSGSTAGLPSDLARDLLLMELGHADTRATPHAARSQDLREKRPLRKPPARGSRGNGNSQGNMSDSVQSQD